jgi:hypothetical protein
VKLSKPKIYDEDNNEIIPPEGATGFVAGMEAMQCTFDNPGHTSKFIYIPEPYTGPIAENVEETFKFSEVPIITDDTWYHRMKGIKTRMKTRVLRPRRKKL